MVVVAFDGKSLCLRTALIEAPGSGSLLHSSLTCHDHPVPTTRSAALGPPHPHPSRVTARLLPLLHRPGLLRPSSAMSEPPTDPPDARMLFSPLRREPSSDAPIPADTSISADDDSDNLTTLPHPPIASCYVSVPEPSGFQRAKYQPVAQRKIESDEEFGQEGAERIVGEWEAGKSVYFYVRYADGVVYRVSGC